MANGEKATLTNRQSPFSDAFKQFICEGWAPYSSEPPAPLPGAVQRPRIARSSPRSIRANA